MFFLRIFANDVGLSPPENITSTKLRKHVATVSQILNLRESYMDAMANFMGMVLMSTGRSTVEGDYTGSKHGTSVKCF